MNPEIDLYLDKAQHWQEEMRALRMICLDCGLTEELKWSKPSYTFQKKIVVVIQGFKAYCALLFYKGMLLNDTHHILIKTGDNTIVGRQVRFANVDEIMKLEPILKEYLHQAIEVEKSGVKVSTKEKPQLVYPEEFQQQLDADAALKTAFSALTPGRQRAYHMHFSQPKQSQTRASRVEKCLPQILAGKGLND